jgi:hypothetical protein
LLELTCSSLRLIVGFALLGHANILHPISNQGFGLGEDPKFWDRGALLIYYFTGTLQTVKLNPSSLSY